MRLRVPWRTRLKPVSKQISHSNYTFPDVMWTSMCALRESADVFPSLKSAVAGVLALWDIAEVS
jgi:hypothetical protein